MAFATQNDVAVTLNRTFSADEQAWVDELCGQASTYLQSVIGQEVYPKATATFMDWPDAGRVDLPQFPIVSIDAVQRDGVDVPFDYRPGFVLVSGDDPVDVTFTYGYSKVPDELRRLTVVLVSQSLTALELGLGVTVGGLSSVALDDFRAAFADGGESTGMVLPSVQRDHVRAQFGRGGIGSVRYG